METFGRAVAYEQLHRLVVEADNHVAKNQVFESDLAHEINVAVAPVFGPSSSSAEIFGTGALAAAT